MLDEGVARRSAVAAGPGRRTPPRSRRAIAATRRSGRDPRSCPSAHDGSRRAGPRRAGRAADRAAARLARRTVRRHGGDGAAAVLQRRASSWRRPDAARRRRRRDRRRRLADGEDADERLGRLPAGAGERRYRAPCCTSRRAAGTCFACRATCSARTRWASATCSSAWAIPSRSVTTRTAATTSTSPRPACWRSSRRRSTRGVDRAGIVDRRADLVLRRRRRRPERARPGARGTPPATQGGRGRALPPVAALLRGRRRSCALRETYEKIGRRAAGGAADRRRAAAAVGAPRGVPAQRGPGHRHPGRRARAAAAGAGRPRVGLAGGVRHGGGPDRLPAERGRGRDLRDAAVRPLRPRRRGRGGGPRPPEAAHHRAVARATMCPRARSFVRTEIHRKQTVSETVEKAHATLPPVLDALFTRIQAEEPVERRDAVLAFARAFLRRIPDEDLEELGTDHLFAMTRSAFAFTDSRGNHPSAVRVFVPTPEEHGYTCAGTDPGDEHGRLAVPRRLGERGAGGPRAARAIPDPPGRRHGSRRGRAPRTRDVGPRRVAPRVGDARRDRASPLGRRAGRPRGEGPRHPARRPAGRPRLRTDAGPRDPHDGAGAPRDRPVLPAGGGRDRRLPRLAAPAELRPPRLPRVRPAGHARGPRRSRRPRPRASASCPTSGAARSPRGRRWRRSPSTCGAGSRTATSW